MSGAGKEQEAKETGKRQGGYGKSIPKDAFHFVRLTLHLQPPFPLLPDVGEGELPRLLVELHRLVLLHAVRRLHPFHLQRLPVVEVRHLPVAELFPRQAFHQAVQRVDAVLVTHALRHELRVIPHPVRVQCGSVGRG